MARTKSTKISKSKDGLTKDQRYHLKNTEKRNKDSRERNRRTRAAAKKSQTAETQASLGEPSTSRTEIPGPIPTSAYSDPFDYLPGPPVTFSDSLFAERLEKVESMTQEGEATHPGSASDTPEWDRFRQLHLLVLRWSSPWGGGKKATREWLRAVWAHAETGKRFLDLLRITNLPLPKDPVNLQLLVTKKIETVELLVRGIVIIETRYDIMGRGVFSVPGAPIDDADDESDDPTSENSEDENEDESGEDYIVEDGSNDMEGSEIS
ncbi:hypothetical protein D9611_009510 [Ephemerocybe angulata]|uniref:Uncharacterized protein n=1 Tax=Ephemerocybe angulata TaxID=980116 RepID=A0A8H5AV89_9AGAR|nr:hypothetical protein D9611_009510 [Tulosesus angulatus]